MPTGQLPTTRIIDHPPGKSAAPPAPRRSPRPPHAHCPLPARTCETITAPATLPVHSCPMPAPDPPPRAAFLERALLFALFAHALAMLSMALLLLPGMPGGGTASDADRVAYIANRPWLWRLGWFPWQLTALSDVLLGLALVYTK